MKVTFRDIAFEHWPDCRLVSNSHIELLRGMNLPDLSDASIAAALEPAFARVF